MKNILKYSIVVIIMALPSQEIIAQGMQTVGGAGSRFAKLKTPNPVNTNAWERAVGIYQNTITPQSYLEINTNTSHLPNPLPTLTGLGLGEMFRTSSPVDAHWRMFANGRPVGHFYSSGNGTNLNIETNYQTQIGSGPTQTGGDIIFSTSGPLAANLNLAGEKMRILGNRNLNPVNVNLVNRSGYIGINNSNPLFHLDMVTNAFGTPGGGELFFRATTSDVAGTDLGFCNASGTNGQMLPTVFGKTGAGATTPALMTLGNIDVSQDATAMNASAWAVTRFFSSKGWQYNNFNGVPQPVQNINLFSWSNASLIDMIMNSNGRLRIKNNMNPLTDIPGNRLEITASAAGGVGTGPADPYMPITNNIGASGLRLTLMKSTNATIPNPGNGVLSVDQNGDVIYVPNGGGGAFGNACTAPPASKIPLTTDWEIPLNSNSFNFTTPANTPGRVSIGATNCPTLPARLYVFDDHLGAGIGCQVISNNSINPGSFGNRAGRYETVNTGTGFAHGIHAIAISTGSGPEAVGLVGESNALLNTIQGTFNGNSGQNIGVRGRAKDGTNNSIGTTGEVINSSSSVNMGVYGDCVSGNGGQNSFGGYFNASGGANLNYGVYSQVLTSGPNNYAFYSNGPQYSTSGSNWSSSDRKLKKDITDLNINAIELIFKLKTHEYYYDQENFKSMNLPKGKQWGFIAQELETVIPEMVKDHVHPAQYDKSGNKIAEEVQTKAVQYDRLFPVLVKAIQEQQAQIDSQKLENADLRTKLAELEKMIIACCANSVQSKINNSQNVNLSDKNIIVLNQNVPNPFAESTVITYNIPNDFTKAQILFTSTEGKIIKTVDITEKGEGRLNVFASDLSSGMYSYSLVVDGKVIDTKKMVKGN